MKRYTESMSGHAVAHSKSICLGLMSRRRYVFIDVPAFDLLRFPSLLLVTGNMMSYEGPILLASVCECFSTLSIAIETVSTYRHLSLDLLCQ